jgi:hypothetical protein
MQKALIHTYFYRKQKEQSILFILSRNSLDLDNQDIYYQITHYDTQSRLVSHTGKRTK